MGQIRLGSIIHLLKDENSPRNTERNVYRDHLLHDVGLKNALSSHMWVQTIRYVPITSGGLYLCGIRTVQLGLSKEIDPLICSGYIFI
jgi:hypothetical protein